MKKCSECKVNEIEDKYIFCLDCVKKAKAKKEEEKNKEETKQKETINSFKGISDLIKNNEENSKAIINTLEQLNNNLYAIRTQNDYFLFKEKKALNWNKKKKKFEITGV